MTGQLEIHDCVMLVGILRCQLIICLYLRYLVPMVLTMKITVFWDMTPCSLIKFIRLYGIMSQTIEMFVCTFFKSLFLGQNVTGFTCHGQRTTAI